MCGDWCRGLEHWCNERNTGSCGNFTTTADRLCSNVTFWSQVGGECGTDGFGAEGERCRGTYSGQCIYPTTSDYQLSRTCQDLSDQVHKINMTCPSGDRVILASEEIEGGHCGQVRRLRGVIFSTRGD